MSGNSMPEGKPYAISKIIDINPSTVLDIGAGRGAYATIMFLYKPNIVFDAVEVWEPYVERFNLNNKYRNIYIEDVRNIDNFSYDLVIFGDVLEHMPMQDAIHVWNKMAKQAKYALISIPIVHMPQDELDDNPYEIHEEENWSTDLVLEKFHSIIEYQEFKCTGIFIAKFGENND